MIRALGRLLLVLAALVAAMPALTGCAARSVAAYEREHLADPIMSFTPNPVSNNYLDHVFESREGAKGATGSIGGGCGCN